MSRWPQGFRSKNVVANSGHASGRQLEKAQNELFHPLKITMLIDDYHAYCLGNRLPYTEF
ncbi:MAG: hypothetical protein IPM82_07745 [Saprospiraceae bacterium]|nr:hypothetical protein [Saprospiraceae bacterium]